MSSSTNNITNNRRECYAKALYIEIILDVTKGVISSPQSLEGFKSIFDWMLKGMISEEEFYVLFLQWVRQLFTVSSSSYDSGDLNSIRTISESDWMNFMEIYTEYQLDVLLGLLVKIQNSDLKEMWNRSEEWIKSVEHLFFLLDTDNKTLLSVEEILILLIVITSDYGDGANRTPETLLKQTFEIMKEANAYKGDITLRRFKEYFHRNCLEKETIESSVVLIEKEVADLNLINKSKFFL